MNSYLNEPKLFISKADILRALSNPQRLCIVRNLSKTEKLCVNDMKVCLDESQPNVSQHIAKLKAAGIIYGKRDGKNIYYSLCENDSAEIAKDLIEVLFTEK
ncbi:MAG: helix-turn-helix transcriptional regulator [Peptostreptococcaceae bacterium]|nr:helix-turn-helix transcriptional regulator [Peptostreptococcaceae bacterium]